MFCSVFSILSPFFELWQLRDPSRKLRRNFSHLPVQFTSKKTFRALKWCKNKVPFLLHCCSGFFLDFLGSFLTNNYFGDTFRWELQTIPNRRIIFDYLFLTNYYPQNIFPVKILANEKGINFEPPFPPGQDVFFPRHHVQSSLNSTDEVVPWSCPGATLVTTRSKSILRPGTHNPRVVPNNSPPPKDNGFRAIIIMPKRHLGIWGRLGKFGSPPVVSLGSVFGALGLRPLRTSQGIAPIGTQSGGRRRRYF